jgi:hypothetical protein
VEEKNNAHRVEVRKSEGKRLFGRHTPRWQGDDEVVLK